MAQPQPTNGTTPHDPNDSDTYGGTPRFALELEFTQLLSNPLYVHHLATQKRFDDPQFVEYIKYLGYFRRPEYLRYLQYPGPTLRMLELLREEQFRRDLINPAVIDRMVREGFEAATGTGTGTGTEVGGGK